MRDIARSSVPLVRDCAGGVFEGERVHVIGDTPHAVRCGRAIGARTIAVASGTSTCAELEAAGAWVVLGRLPPLPRFRELIGIG